MRLKERVYTMAAFIAKQDYFGIADEATVVCISSNDGKAAEVAEATNEIGNVYGVKLSPSNEYQLARSLDINKGSFQLGGITTHGDVSICLGSMSIGTSAGSAPTISASGEQVESGASADCWFDIPAFRLEKCHHAQILFNAFTYNATSDNVGTGVHLKSASYDASCSITKGEKEGVCLTHDVTEGKIECSVEFIQTGSTVPEITAGSGWVVTSPLACSNPDADWPTWNATLTMYIPKSQHSEE